MDKDMLNLIEGIVKKYGYRLVKEDNAKTLELQRRVYDEKIKEMQSYITELEEKNDLLYRKLEVSVSKAIDDFITTLTEYKNKR